MIERTFHRPAPVSEEILNAIQQVIPVPVRGHDIPGGNFFRRLRPSEMTRAGYNASWAAGTVSPRFRRLH